MLLGLQNPLMFCPVLHSIIYPLVNTRAPDLSISYCCQRSTLCPPLMLMSLRKRLVKMNKTISTYQGNRTSNIQPYKLKLKRRSLVNFSQNFCWYNDISALKHNWLSFCSYYPQLSLQIDPHYVQAQSTTIPCQSLPNDLLDKIHGISHPQN